MERKTSYEEPPIVIYTKNKYVTGTDRQRAMDTMLETGRPVIVRAREGSLRRMFRRLWGEES